MDSITKTKLSEEQIIMLVKKAFGGNQIIKEIRELKDGFFNSGYMVSLNNGQKSVLKVSPSKEVRLMRYEKDIMDTEVFVLNKLSLLQNFPAPRVLFYDNSKEIIDNAYFFMEFLDGQPLNKVRGELSDEQYSSISSQAAECMKKINGIKGDFFGCISQEDKRFFSWGEAFFDMIKDLLDDAEDAKVILPYKNEEIYSLISRFEDILNKVHTPSLVHKDLWEGNIFINPETYTINGIIDCERALFGDELLDSVCAFLLDNKIFMEVYFGRTELNSEEYIKSLLYKVYLFLLMVIECPFRQYPDDNQEKWARAMLVESYEQLVML